MRHAVDVAGLDESVHLSRVTGTLVFIFIFIPTLIAALEHHGGFRVDGRALRLSSGCAYLVRVEPIASPPPPPDGLKVSAPASTAPVADKGGMDFTEGSSNEPGSYVIEKAFVER